LKGQKLVFFIFFYNFYEEIILSRTSF